MESDADRRRRGGAEDFISRLPDEILHSILLRLPSTAAAVRTSLLTRRWRKVWAHMPELVLGGQSPAPASFALLDSVDSALSAYSAPTLRRLEVCLDRGGRFSFPARRVAHWLLFASQRLAGGLELRLPLPGAAREGDKEDIFLPICERATEIKLFFSASFVLRPSPTGSFTELTELVILCAIMDGREMGRVVSSQCPRLRKLVIVVQLVAACDVSICSESIKSLHYYAGAEAGSTRKLEVVAPRLTKISVSLATEAYIVAPKLEKVIWHDDPYDPSRHQFAVAGRHIQRLWITQSAALLMRLFDTVNELRLDLSIPQGMEGYMSFLKDTDKLPVCETLSVSVVDHHALAPKMFHLLRRCSCIRKLKLHLGHGPPLKTRLCMARGCPCRLPGNYKVDKITFDSLEEIELFAFRGSATQEQFVELLLSRCDTGTFKKLDINVEPYPVSSAIMVVCERIRSMCHPNCKVGFHVFTQKGRVTFSS